MGPGVSTGQKSREYKGRVTRDPERIKRASQISGGQNMSRLKSGP